MPPYKREIPASRAAKYLGATGQAKQMLLGLDELMGVRLRFKLTLFNSTRGVFRLLLRKH